MQGQDQSEGLKSSGNSISMGPYGHQPRPSFGGLRDRQGGSMPPINTSRASQHASASDMQTPGTGYDLSFSALLPSQLLVGSPFATTTPQFQGFPTFPQTSSNNHQSQPGHSLGSPVPQQSIQQPLSPQLYQGMNLNSALAGGPSFGANQPFQQQQFGGFTGYGNHIGSQINSGLVSGTSRTVYLGNIPSDATAEEILGHVRSGQIESVRLLLDKNCAFISFLDSSSAVHFHSDAILKKLSIRGQDIKVGWGKPSQVPSSVALAIQQSGASRNVYLGNLPTETSEEELREDLGKYGPIDTIKLVREKAIGFVHFLSISNAIKAVTQLPQEAKWQPPRRVFYGKDRCAYVSKTQQQNAAQYLGIAPGYANVLNTTDRDLISNALAQQSVAAAAVATAAGGANNLGNRTVYLGNIHPETTGEEICNVVRGGLLHHIRYIPDKHICFVTFIDPTSAASFFALSNVQGLMIHNRRLKIGWGKHSGALPPAIALAVSGGASRNVYIGNIDDTWSEDRLRQDFSEYGEIELVNALREKSCAFVNFTNIANAIKAIEGIRGKEEYKRFKINFGKDRCGNPPRQMNNNSNNHNNSNSVQAGFNGGASTDGVTPPPHADTQQNQNGIAAPTHMPNGTLQGLPGVANGNNNPLTQYLNQLSQSLQHQQQPSQSQHFNPSLSHLSHQPDRYSPHHPFDADSQDASQMFGRFPYDTPSPQNSDHQQQPQSHYSYHGSSNSFTGGLAANHSATPSTVGGFLAPSMGMNASQKSQHARALSMPAFSQIPPPSHHSKMSNGGGIGALTSGLGGLGLGPSVNGYNAAENTLPRWAEEEVGSS